MRGLYIEPPKAYDPANEHQHREMCEREFTDRYSKRSDLVVPFGKTLGFMGPNGEKITFGYSGGTFSTRTDAGTATNYASVSQLLTVDNKLQASYALTLDVNGKIAQMKLLSNGTTSAIAFRADTFQVFNGTSDTAPFEVVGGVVKIKSAQIGDLNANNIVAGTLSVARIADATLDTIKLAVGAVSVGVTDTDVGGALTGSVAEFCEVGVTIPAGGYVELHWSFSGGMKLANSTYVRIGLRLTRYLGGVNDGNVELIYPMGIDDPLAELGSIGSSFSFGQNAGGTAKDAPAAGTYTYKLGFFFEHSTDSACSASNIRLEAVVHKR